MTRVANLILSMIWVLWGSTFADPASLVKTYPIDPYQFGFVVVLGLITPCLGCWYYAQKYPGHPLWLRPSLSVRLRLMLSRGQPTWIFVLAYSFFIAGVSCGVFAQWRRIPLSGYHLVYLLTGVALMAGSVAALRLFEAHFAASADQPGGRSGPRNDQPR